MPSLCWIQLLGAMLWLFTTTPRRGFEGCRHITILGWFEFSNWLRLTSIINMHPSSIPFGQWPATRSKMTQEERLKYDTIFTPTVVKTREYASQTPLEHYGGGSFEAWWEAPVRTCWRPALPTTLLTFHQHAILELDALKYRGQWCVSPPKERWCYVNWSLNRFSQDKSELNLLELRR